MAHGSIKKAENSTRERGRRGEEDNLLDLLSSRSPRNSFLGSEIVPLILDAYHQSLHDQMAEGGGRGVEEKVVACVRVCVSKMAGGVDLVI
jgi:hypothetical protein